MMSPSFAKSPACLKEARALCNDAHLERRLIPIMIDPMRIDGSMFGTTRSLKQDALLVKASIGNLLPPPDQGCFPDNFGKNLLLLKDRIAEVLEEVRVERGEPLQPYFHGTNLHSATSMKAELVKAPEPSATQASQLTRAPPVPHTKAATLDPPSSQPQKETKGQGESRVSSQCTEFMKRCGLSWDSKLWRSVGCIHAPDIHQL